MLEPSVVFLGFRISEAGILPAIDKTAAIQKIASPKTQLQVLSFIAMAQFFKRHIKNYSAITEPLLKLIRKGASFCWTDECQKSFDSIKAVLCEPPLLAHASELDEPDAKCILFTDASQYAIGSCLSVLKEGTLRPISYQSRILNKAERNYSVYSSNYSVYSKEFLAMVVAITEHL